MYMKEYSFSIHFDTYFVEYVILHSTTQPNTYYMHGVRYRISRIGMCVFVCLCSVHQMIFIDGRRKSYLMVKLREKKYIFFL